MKLGRGIAVFVVCCLFAVLAMAALAPALLGSTDEWRETAAYAPELLRSLTTPDGRAGLREAMYYADVGLWVAMGGLVVTFLAGVLYAVILWRRRVIRPAGASESVARLVHPSPACRV